LVCLKQYGAVDATPRQIRKLAEKLIEVFAAERIKEHRFGRYWPLAGALETFSECAVGPLEQDVAKALSIALENRLREVAPRSIQPDASAVGQMLGSRYPRRRYRVRRR
jgi:hypothetical protein